VIRLSLSSAFCRKPRGNSGAPRGPLNTIRSDLTSVKGDAREHYLVPMREGNYANCSLFINQPRSVRDASLIANWPRRRLTLSLLHCKYAVANSVQGNCLFAWCQYNLITCREILGEINEKKFNQSGLSLSTRGGSLFNVIDK